MSSSATSSPVGEDAPEKPRPNQPAKTRSWIARVVLPRAFVEPARDLAKDNAEKASAERAVIARLVVYVPLAGVVAVTVNLAVQVRGYQSLSLAIIENLSLGSLALVVLTNLLIYLLPATAIGLTNIRRDLSFTPALRRTALHIQLLILVMSVFVLPWILTAIVAVFTLLFWRFPLWSLGGSGSLSIESWLAPPAPMDIEHRRYWLEGRRWQRANGVSVVAVPGLDEDDDGVKTDPADLSEAINARAAVIASAVTRSAPHAVFITLVTALSIYGFTALISQVQLAPLEKVTIQGQGSQVGYIFSSAPGTGIFVPRTMDSLTHLEDVKVTNRQLCGRDWISGPIVGLWAKPTGVVCST